MKKALVAEGAWGELWGQGRGCGARCTSGGAVGPRPGCGARRTSRGITSRAGGVPLGKRDEKASCEHCPEECVRARLCICVQV